MFGIQSEVALMIGLQKPKAKSSNSNLQNNPLPADAHKNTINFPNTAVD